MRVFALYAESLASGYFLWLGLFIISRGLPLPVLEGTVSRWWRRSDFAAGLSLVLASWFVFGAAVRSILAVRAQYILAFRLTWWVIPLSAASWLWAVLNLPGVDGRRKGSPPPTQLVAWTLVGFSLLAAVAGLSSEHIFRYAETQVASGRFDRFYIPPALPQHLAYIAILLMLLWGTALVLWGRYRSSPADLAARRGFWYLAVGNGVFAGGATFSVVAHVVSAGRLPEQVGNWIATSGLVLLGFGIVTYNALIEQRVVRQDYWRSLRGVAIAVATALALFHAAFRLFGETLPILNVPLLVFLITLFATPIRWYRWLIDRWTLPVWQARFMMRLTQVRQQVMTTPDPRHALALLQDEMVEIAEEAQIGQLRAVVDQEIEALFRHKTLQKDDVLAESRLFQLRPLQKAVNAFALDNVLLPSQLSSGEKARVLRLFLERFIDEEVCPQPGQAPPRPPSDRWLQYLILRKSYLENKTRREVVWEVERETSIRLAGRGRGTAGGRTYATHLKRAREHLAERLWQHAIRE